MKNERQRIRPITSLSGAPAALPWGSAVRLAKLLLRPPCVHSGVRSVDAAGQAAAIVFRARPPVSQ